MSTLSVVGHGILRIDGKRKGPVIGVICNVHGNELCGRKAAQRVLQKHTIERGSLILIDGNQEAALLNQRYSTSAMSNQT